MTALAYPQAGWEFCRAGTFYRCGGNRAAALAPPCTAAPPGAGGGRAARGVLGGPAAAGRRRAGRRPGRGPAGGLSPALAARAELRPVGPAQRGHDDVADNGRVVTVTGAGGEIRAGDRVLVDGVPRVVLGASGAVIRFAGDDGTVEEAPVAGLVGSGRLRLPPRGANGEPGGRTGLAGLPPDAAERARWWEAHIIEVVDGTRPDAPAGCPAAAGIRRPSAPACASASTPRRPSCPRRAGRWRPRPSSTGGSGGRPRACPGWWTSG